MAATTKTLNPLHFEDLEPHRFEDLVRQLAYDFRTWSSLEATGRSGSDEGMDIRAMERMGSSAPAEEPKHEEDDEAQDEVPETSDRLWVIQCKREKTQGPAKVKAILNEYFKTGPTPYGYILAAACDFSKAARDAGAEILRKKGVQEFYFWGKAEIEDMLFQPKNDHLLFAYFGISLQVRRRSMRTDLRFRLTLKRKLVKTLGGVSGTHYQTVLIRDPRDEDYPFIASAAEFLKAPRWRYWQFHSHEPPDHVAFLTARLFAYANWDTGEWDIIESRAANQAVVRHPELHGVEFNDWDPKGYMDIASAWWELHVAEANRAYGMQVKTVPYERILLCDEIGDHYNEGPHLLVEYHDGSPFERDLTWLEPEKVRVANIWSPRDEKRIKYFPDPIPDETEAHRTLARAKLDELTKKGRIGN